MLKKLNEQQLIQHVLPRLSIRNVKRCVYDRILLRWDEGVNCMSADPILKEGEGFHVELMMICF